MEEAVGGGAGERSSDVVEHSVHVLLELLLLHLLRPVQQREPPDRRLHSHRPQQVHQPLRGLGVCGGGRDGIQSPLVPGQVRPVEERLESIRPVPPPLLLLQQPSRHLPQTSHVAAEVAPGRDHMLEEAAPCSLGEGELPPPLLAAPPPALPVELHARPVQLLIQPPHMKGGDRVVLGWREDGEEENFHLTEEMPQGGGGRSGSSSSSLAQQAGQGRRPPGMQ
eukprot:749325-Hanusia_phi.AAC.1